MRGMADQKAVNSQMNTARVMALLHCSFVPVENKVEASIIIINVLGALGKLCKEKKGKQEGNPGIPKNNE